MSDREKCREFAELFPLRFNGQLDESRVNAMSEHLGICSSCREEYLRERLLFAVASSESAGTLDSHPEAELLDNFVRNSASIDTEQLQNLHNHIDNCAICRDTVDKLKNLPNDLEYLIPGTIIPFITELDQISNQPERQDQTTDIRPRLRKPLTVLAAAAVVVIVAVTIFRSDRVQKTAVLEVSFPAVTRAAAPPTQFGTKNENFVFSGKIFIDPEESHQYRLAVRDATGDTVIYESGHEVDIDTTGFAHFELPLSPGSYELVIWDIEGTDSISISRPFEIKLIR